MNMGAWSFLDRRLENVLTELSAQHPRPLYVGRTASAATATGVLSRHLAEQQQVVAQALALTS
jgi:2-oxoglutarate dehydrogenase E1 component